MILGSYKVILYFTLEVFCRLANQNRGHIGDMLEWESDPH